METADHKVILSYRAMTYTVQYIMSMVIAKVCGTSIYRISTLVFEKMCLHGAIRHERDDSICTLECNVAIIVLLLV